MLISQMSSADEAACQKLFQLGLPAEALNLLLMVRGSDSPQLGELGWSGTGQIERSVIMFDKVTKHAFKLVAGATFFNRKRSC